MKRLLFLFIPLFVFSQQRDPRSDQFNFVPGELIVKLKDDVDAGIVYASVGQTPPAGKLVAKNSISKEVSRIIGLDAAVKSQEALFSKESVDNSIRLKQQKTLQRVQQQRQLQANSTGGSTSSSATKDEPEEFLSLKNVVKLELEDKNANILELVEKLKDNPNIEYIEPNYIFSINDFEIASDIIYDKDLSPISTTSTTVPNDPLYSQQTNITQTNIDDVWNEYTTGDGSQIVAILDTGVDYTHPDLAANIWINEAELNGVEGFDDDGNGYIDDIRGWDFINNDNAPLDDNMHGTHVAGIVGAVGDNGIGVSGAAWNVKLMPIKVFQSNGVGNSTTIAEGVNYATANGATIQNMSFGSYAESSTLKSAIENAYASSLLVAAAGNDKICIGPRLCPDKTPSAPLYPGAYTFVLGVEDGNGIYDNYDQDGPIYSGYSNFLNYEVKAPGSGIMNTVPNGGYRALTGTSMATPLVAGAMALYMQQKPDDSKELIFGNLINTSGQNVDIKAAIDVVPTPVLKVLSADIKDEINDQNNNGFWEPGETLELFPMIKNYWGPTDDVRVGIEFWEFEDTSKAEILESEIAIGSISAYANLQKLDQSLKIKLADNIANNVNIQFKVSVWSGDNQDYLSSQKIVVNVKNSILLFGIYDTDLTLEKDKEYLVSDNLVMRGSSILKINPGVILKIADNKTFNVIENAKLLAIGNKNDFITFTAEDNEWKSFSLNTNSISEFKYVIFENIGGFDSSCQSFFPCPTGQLAIYEDVIIRNSRAYYGFNGDVSSVNYNSTSKPTYNRVNLVENYMGSMITDDRNLLSEYMKDINIINNSGSFGIGAISATSDGRSFYNNISTNLINNFNSNGNLSQSIVTSNSTQNGVTTGFNIYLGSANDDIINSNISDLLTEGRTGLIERKDISKLPHEGSHGIVWKVLVNGKDAQDEYDEMDPIGVGTHEFKVYFNREMDTSVDPQISYGVREPYNQKIISEQGTWSTDGKIYTVTHDVNIGAADGINRIRVQDARDLDYFEIPVEDYRFNMLVQSAGSASTGFMATAGLGEITLNWTPPSESDLNDVLGYNMYRYTANEDGTFTDPVKINESLIADITFKDYDVARDTQYFYKYKILRTSFEETDYSNAVSSQLLTAALGDSNGDSSVNLMDVVNTVDYILGNNPTPFVDYATDVNNDSSVNVLDVVGIVDMILNPTTSSVRLNGEPINYVSNAPVGEAELFWRDNDLYVKTDKPISGLQLSFDGDLSFTASELLEGYELNNFMIDDKRVVMAYSFDGFQITPGTHKLLSTSNKPLDVTAGAMATSYGESIFVLYNQGAISHIDAPLQTDKLEVLSVSPNPSNGLIKLHYYLPEQMDNLSVGVFDLSGRLMWNSGSFKNTKGHARASLDLQKLSTGTYIMMINANRSGETKFNHTTKIVIE
ncbi:MAG: S8 family serine peptidase [Bacteroidetes bacterium]|nr:S8 family serine peptidase [Bacteroidota bacterium]MDA1084672.1 S8 family serine peptidase [Bacteroidota bacterium]